MNSEHQVIWKYPLNYREEQTVQMPANARILSVQEQRGQLCLWALVYPDAPKEPRIIEVMGTGNLLPVAGREHLGTVLLEEGLLVLHIFERLTK